jgi:hypothetical protein
MRLLSLLTMGLLVPLSCHATSLQQLVQVLAAPPQKARSSGGWARVGQLPGMKWEQSAPRQTPAGFARHGSLNLEGLGDVSVYFIGSRAGAQQASLALPEGVDKREFTLTLHRLIPLAKIKQLRGGCKDDGDTGGSAVYQLDVSGSATVYAMMVSGTSRSGMDTELVIAKQMDKNWECAS